LTIRVAAHDPDCTTGTCTTGCGLYIRADLTQWSASGGTYLETRNGFSASPYSAEADWQAPQDEGLYTLGVQVSDSGTSLCGGRQSTQAEVDIQVTSNPAPPPEILLLAADPPRIFPGAASQIVCVAADPGGGEVTFGWETDLGSLDVVAPGTAAFTSEAPGIASVTCTATAPSGLFASASVPVSVSGAVVEKSLTAGLVSPQRIALDSVGTLFVADRGGTGVTALNLFTGQLTYRLPAAGIRSLAVDWADRLVAGLGSTAGVFTRGGQPLFWLDPEQALGEVSDVAVDLVNRRYAVLYGTNARVVIFDESGARLGAFGSTGDAEGQMKSPSGIAATPAGHWAVADRGHGLVRLFDSAGSPLLAFGGTGGLPGEFVALQDVDVGANGLIYASDSFRDRIQVFEPDGTLREIYGGYGEGPGELDTLSGVLVADGFERLLAASLDGGSVEVWRTGVSVFDPPLPAAVATPASLAFPPTPIGVTSGLLSVQLTNVGGAPLGVLEVSVSQAFSVSHDCGAVLDPGASCALGVRFVPTRPGAESGALRLETSAPGGAMEIALSGSGFLPAEIEIAPASIFFVDTAVGATGGPIAAVATNTGTVAATVAAVTTSGDFAHATDCLGTLPGGASCTMWVYFTPGAAGDDLSGFLTMVSDAIGSPDVVPLGGAAISLRLEVAPDRLDFGVTPVGETSPPRSAVATSVGGEGVLIGSSWIAGEHPSDFGIVADGCGGARLDVGVSCAIEVVFAPTARGVRTATLTIPSAAPEAPHIVALSGGIEALIFEDDFESGDLRRWDQVLVLLAPAGGAAFVAKEIRNGGTIPAEIGPSTVIGGDAGRFWIERDGCGGRRLAPGEACDVVVGFAAVGAGERRSALRLETCAPDCRVEAVTLIGREVPP